MAVKAAPPDLGHPVASTTLRPAAEINDLCFAYVPGAARVFDGFSWTVQPAETWAIIGSSGCGKSTLLYLLAGLRQPTAGTVLVGGYPVPRPRASTGLILQNHGLLPWATVWENAALGVRIGRQYARKTTPPGEPRPYPPVLPVEAVDGWLERLGIAALRDKYPGQISGGQQQRVAIARTLVLSPSLLLLDEPFSALDALTREDLQDLLVALHRETGVTTILVTHNVEEAAATSEKILVLGSPPNRRAMIVVNPAAGTPGYRATPEFLHVTSELRARLNERAT